MPLKERSNINLKPLDDLFATEESRADAQREKVQEIPLGELHPFRNHPFKVKDDAAMQDTVDSVREYGVLVPAIARPDPDGGYELIAGHRRHHASELAGKETMPVIVRDLDDDAATIIMVDSNLQREELLPSERAFAYKMKLEAIRHQGKRQELRRCLKMAKASHERKRLFPQHFWASENRVQKGRHSRKCFHKEFPSGMSYKPAGKDDGIFRPLPKRLFWILWCRWRMLRARLNSSHSAATFVLPRSRKRRKSRSCFTYAKLPSA